MNPRKPYETFIYLCIWLTNQRGGNDENEMKNLKPYPNLEMVIFGEAQLGHFKSGRVGQKNGLSFGKSIC